jgi:hypothetical protein|tara:strand:- start:870 stop:1367 length:498 start_codon:yes stop_codon:yes gene_type:complete
MKELLTITENKVIPSAYALTIPEFKTLKLNELAFVYFFTDHESPYAPYDEPERLQKLSDDLKIKASPKITGAIDKYKELSETSAVKLLKAARTSVTKLEKYFKTIDLTALDDHGKPIYHAKDLVSNLANMGKVVSSLDELESLVRKQKQRENPNRGGVTTNKYSS